MKLYTIKKDSTFFVSSDIPDQPIEPMGSITTPSPITFTEDNVDYEGTCSDPECDCEVVTFVLPLIIYNVDRSNIVVSEVV
jgi:hypothetical protein